MSFKTRSQLVIALIVVVVSAILSYYHIALEKRYATERMVRSSENIKRTFDAIVEDTERLYQFRSRTTLNMLGVLEAVEKRDTATLYQLVAPRYKSLQEDNPYLTIMQFHASDGRSILRAHLPERYGDDIAAQRATLREIHRTHATITSFEGGLGGMAFRVIVPIFKNGRYIGALEHGLESGYFVDKIKQLTGTNSIVMVHKTWLGAADRKVFSEGIGEYYYTGALKENSVLMALFSRENPTLRPRLIEYNGRNYEINPLFLRDTKNRELAVIVSINDVTGMNQSVVETFAGSIAVTLVLAVIIWGLFEYAFRTLIGKVHLQEQYIETILDSQKNIVIVTDGNAIIYANRAFFDYFGCESLAAFQKAHGSISSFFESNSTQEYLQADMDGVGWTNYLIENSSKEIHAKMTVEGVTSIFSVHSKKMEYEGKARHVVVFTDITQLNELATKDILTHLSNRFQFDKVMEHSIQVASRYGRVFSMLLIDIDHFKLVNDRYGHQAGDDVLKKLAVLLTDHVRKSDLVARWGGEELVILLPDSDLASAVKLAELLRKRIEESDFAPVEKVTCSIGVVQWHIGESSDSLLHRADEKLYQAKEGGRNRVVS